MGFRINTNIAAMNAHMFAQKTNAGLDKSLASLSSGLRINKAADDASGMSIADSLRQQAQGLGQAIRNANDGVGVVQTADGALDEYTNIINTIRTKAIQAASDGQSTDSRAAIQSDIDRLLEEAQNIASTTSFNGLTLLNGGFQNKAFHIGAYSGETVKINIDDAQIASVGNFATSAGITAITSGALGAATSLNVQLGTITVSTGSFAGTTGNTSLQNAQALVDLFNKDAQMEGVSIRATVVEATASTGHYTIRLDAGASFGVNSAAGTGVNDGVVTSANTLDKIDVTTRADAEFAIIIADYALKDINGIRSDIGSVQNQLEATVRNISVTQVNVQAAESQIRDVDFAAESANFAKLNILAQSGSYAMSQANAVQQNVLRLL
ncbi:flagellin, partial [Sulfuricurvum sp. UBA5598]|uniref:flagellin N-terminal helical domain-containing protein n=1 Tax=Sulfuricurvum sp. UBA5598 TaxID=1947586 RepID=UPI0025DEAC41